MDMAAQMLMDVMLDLVMVVMICKLLSEKMHGSTAERIIALSMGAGFFVSCISNAVCGGSGFILILTALGFMLSYTALVFTFSKE